MIKPLFSPQKTLRSQRENGTGDNKINFNCFLTGIIPDAVKPQPNIASKIFAKMTRFLGVIA
jgi:hypothetical protein